MKMKSNRPSLISWLFALVCFACILPAHAAEDSPAAETAASETATLPPEEVSLQQAIEIALAQNPDMEIARARLQASQAQIDQARAGLLPRLTNQLTYTERESAVSAMGFGGIGGGSSSINSIIYQDTLTLQVPVYTGGSRQLQVKRARTAGRKSEIDAISVRNDLIALVTEAYLNVLRAISLHKSAGERAEAIAAQRENVAKKVAAELATKSDLLKAEVQLESSRESLLVAENAVHNAKNALSFAMGRDSDWPLNLAPVTSLPLSIGSEEEVMALVRDSNPTLRGIEQQVKILEQGIRIEKAAHLPTVNLNTTYGKSHRDFPPQDKNWSIVGVLDFKVFDGGLQTAKVREAHKRLEEGRALLRKTRQSLQNQVKNALRDYQTAQERVQVSGKGFELATEELRLSRLRTDEGLITLTDHLDNQAEYTRAQMTHIIAQFDVLLSQVRLYKLSGQLDDNFVFHLAPVQENVETKEEAIQ